MLRPLRSALASWTVAAGIRDDPLAAIVHAWPDIVGADVALHTRPAEIAGDSLVIVTTSSAWSQQLALLHDDLLARLGVATGLPTITRLRFRWGSVRPAVLAAPQPSVERRPAQLLAPTQSDASAATVLARLRDRLSAARGTDRPRCRRCDAPVELGMYCAPCRGALDGERTVALERLFYQAPWLNFAQAAAALPALSIADYDRTRRRLLMRWWEILCRAQRVKRAGGFEQEIGRSYVVLQAQLEPHRISRAIICNILGEELEWLLYGHVNADAERRTPFAK